MMPQVVNEDGDGDGDDDEGGNKVIHVFRH